MAWIDAKTLAGALAIALLAPALSGCQTMTDGRRAISAMDADNNRLRSELTIEPVPMTQPTRYSPVARCGYRQVSTRVGAAPVESRFDLSIRPVRDRLLVTMMEDGRASTALIGSDGTLYDFNLTDDQGRRWTTESFAAASAGGGSQINQFMVVFPQYSQNVWNVGDRVAAVHAQDGKIWAEYVYRGLATYQGTQGAVLDLVVSEGLTEIQVAFNVVDIRTMTPLLYVFDSGYKMRLVRGPCS